MTNLFNKWTNFVSGFCANLPKSTFFDKKISRARLSVNKAVLLQNNIFLRNNSLTHADMRQHYLRGLPFLVSKIYYFEVRCSFVAIKILLCRSREMMQGCHLARLFGKSIRDFYARNQYFLMNTQPTTQEIFVNITLSWFRLRCL